jgi:hypothetical protein
MVSFIPLIHVLMHFNFNIDLGVSMPFFVNSYNVIGLLSGVAEDRTELNT